VSAQGPYLLEVGVRWPPETFIGWKLQGLASRGLRVAVASPARGPLDPSLLPGVELLHVPHWDDSASARRRAVARDGLALLRHDPRRLAALVRAVARPLRVRRRTPARLARRLHPLLRLARETPDVVHFEWESAVMAAMPLLEVWDCPVVVSCHGAGVRRHPHSPRFRNSAQTLPRVFARADVVHCVADAVAAEAEQYGLDREKARVIRTAVDHRFFAPAEAARRDGETLRVAAVSRLIWSKGHEYALMAIRELLDLGVPVQYELFGGEPRPDTGEVSDLARIAQTIKDLGLEDHVRLCGDADSDGIREGLRRAHLMLHTSVSDGLPTVIAEAMSCGLPVVVTDVGGVRELVTDGIDGHVLPPRDSRGLALAMKELWDDPDARLRMGRAARERIRADFSLDGLVDEFERLYRGLVEPAGDPHRLRILSAGELSWTQGYEHALHAISELADSGIDCEYRVVGAGAYEGAFRYAAYQLGLGRAVEFHDPAEAPLSEHLRWADVFVSAAVAPGFAAGLQGARAAGVPVVATDAVVSDGVPRRDPSALREALARLAAEPRERVRQ
jgi:glycosyltransferase involved in cell wall biosynthesis